MGQNDLFSEIDAVLSDAELLLKTLKQKMIPEEWSQWDEDTRLKLEVVHGKVLAAMSGPDT
jgi:hypothetical protein